MSIEDFVNSLPDNSFESLLLACMQRANKENKLSWNVIKLVLEAVDKMSLERMNKGLEKTSELLNKLLDAAATWKASR